MNVFYNYTDLLKNIPPIEIVPDMLIDGNIVNEIWLPVFDSVVPGILPGYFVSNYGRFFSTIPSPIGTGLLKPTKVCKNKEYLQIQFRLTGNRRTTMKVHRVVMLTFNYIFDHQLFEVNHKDNNPTHNWLWNLEWCSSSYNTIYAISYGNKKVFSNDYQVLDINMLDKVFTDYNNGYTINELVLKYNINKNSLNAMIRGTNRSYLKKQYNLIQSSIIDMSLGNYLDNICDEISYLLKLGNDIEYIISYIMNKFSFEFPEAAIIKIKRIYRSLTKQNIITFNEYPERE